MKITLFAISAFLTTFGMVSANGNNETMMATSSSPEDGWWEPVMRRKLRSSSSVQRKLHVVYTEDWSSLTVAPWVHSSTQINNFGSLPDIPGGAVASAGYLVLDPTASCFSSPFDGAGSVVTESVNIFLAAGNYEVSADVEQAIDFYAFCSTGATAYNSIIVDGATVATTTITKNGGCGIAGPSSDSFSGQFSLAAAATIVLKLETYATDCGAAATEWDNIKIKEIHDPDIQGDPHVKTWAGKWFDYMGQCDLVMFHVPSFYKATKADEAAVPLDLHVRATVRYQYSYIEAAALRIGDDILEVYSFGGYALNSIDNADLKASGGLNGHTIVYSNPSPKKHVFDVVVNSQTNITLSAYKDLVGVKVTGATMDHFGEAEGLMGAYIDGAMLGRDGKTIMEDDVNAFGQEWQVQADEPKLFRATRDPQAPMKCELPSPKAEAKRRLGETIARDAAERACAHVPADAFDICVFDVMAIGDLEFAQAGAY